MEDLKIAIFTPLICRHLFQTPLCPRECQEEVEVGRRLLPLVDITIIHFLVRLNSTELKFLMIKISGAENRSLICGEVISVVTEDRSTRLDLADMNDVLASYNAWSSRFI